MDWHDLLTAFALYLILEGLIPFANPGAFKRFMADMTQLPDEKLRAVGIGSIIAGLVLLYIVR